MTLNNACSNTDTITQGALLNYLADASVGRVERDENTGRAKVTRANWLTGIDRSKWRVTGFNPRTREVCFTVNGRVPVYAALTIPPQK
jgi:hypothetical protein